MNASPAPNAGSSPSAGRGRASSRAAASGRLRATYDFSRTYLNGAGTAVGTGSASGSQTYAFGRAGPVFRPTSADEIAATGKIGAQAIYTASWTEPLSMANPFSASVAAASQTAGVVKERIRWTHAFTAAVDATVWGAFAQTFDARSTLAASVAGFGAIAPQLTAPQWAEYGLQVGYRGTDHATVEAFLDGVSAQGYASQVHVGGALKWTF